MRVAQLALESFRNYDRQSVHLAPGLNLVTGRNAQGKTNLLEALYCLGGLGSPRSPDAALVMEGADRALLHAEVVKKGRSVRIDMELRAGRGMRALVNKAPLGATRALAGFVVSVFFGPDELSLVKGSPDGRRRFLDDLIVKLRPARQALRREWDRVLRQRNALLRTMARTGSPPGSLEVWDDALCRVGADLAAARLAALGRLMPFARRRYEAIAGGGSLTLTYVSSWLGEAAAAEALAEPASIDGTALRSALQRRLEEVRPRELERRVSLVGPQRDDVVVRLATGPGGAFLDARSHASQGDQRTSALALKLAEHDLLREVLEDDPILLLDDVFSELDQHRRRWLRQAVQEVEQTLLTSAEAGTADLFETTNTIVVDGGKAEAR